MIGNIIIPPGDVFERDHPFTLRADHEHYPEEKSVYRWRPGAWNVDSEDGEVFTSCTAIGRVKFTVVSVHRPPGFQERVFFKREFTTPEGDRYTSGRLMNCITRKFRKDIAAFPFRFDVEQPDLNLEHFGAAA